MFSAVLKYGGKTADELYPLIDRKCAPNSLFEKCYFVEKFPRGRSLINDSQAYKVLDTLRKFTERPAAMKQGW